MKHLHLGPMLAAISLGVYRDLKEAAENMVKVVDRHEPNFEHHRKYLKAFRLYRKLYDALRTLYDEY